MAFKSTVNRTHLRLVREVEAIGGNVSASASCEQMSYTYDALKSYTPEMVEVLIDNVRNPAFLDWEVKEQIRSFVHMANDAFGRRVAKLLGDVFHVLLLVLLKTPLSVVSDREQLFRDDWGNWAARCRQVNHHERALLI
uniref:Peptidase M16 N-terminal domain-containing protein n=1 Tax=Zea mays TaxID=4577 RepID=A0A804MVK7_MAIZE